MCSHHEARAFRGCGREHRYAGPFTFAHHHYPGEQASRGLGVRRPLRFLAWRLDLDEAQVAKLATILNDLKTERAQAEVDDRRALALLADAVQSDAFDAAKAGEAARLRAQSAERLQQKVADSLRGIHETLGTEQREKLAYLLRTGTLVM
jgi:Spy/CpxP family protein refolding chaperone